MKNSGYRILIVEDNAAFLEILSRFLSANGFQVSPFCDGKSALESLMRSSEMPNLILLDLQMPAMSGLEVMRQLKEGKNSALSSIPVILMSGNKEESFDFDVQSFLQKPFPLEEVLLAIRHVLVLNSSSKE